MKILVLGSGGFIGRAVVSALEVEHEIYCGDRNSDGSPNSVEVDLLDQDSIISVLNKVQPEIIINCAGTVENSEKALSVNPIITINILQSVIITKLPLRKMIISGSAGEYGIVEKNGPVNEDTPLLGTSFYARSKILESSVALAIAGTTNLPVIIARIFNPIGAGMHQRFLLPNLIKQADEINERKRDKVEISRLDALRDYINVADIANAIKVLVENNCKESVYNIGSGKPITNKQLLEGIFHEKGVNANTFELIETSDTPEPNYAVNADISRIKNEFGWEPKYDIGVTIKQIADVMMKEEGKDARR